MASASKFYRTHILNIVIPEDEFEEPVALTKSHTFLASAPKRVQVIKMDQKEFQENEMDIARKRIAERNSAFQRRVQYEAAMIKRAIAISAVRRLALS